MLRRRILFAGLFLLMLALIGGTAHQLGRSVWLASHEQQLRGLIAQSPLVAWCLGVAVYFGLSLIPGTGGKAVIAGWLFGVWGAVLMVEIGLTAAAVVSFLVGRYFLGELVQQRQRQWLGLLTQRFARDGASFLLMLRLAHAPFTLLNYAAGAGGVPLASFWWTTHVGILPGTIVFAFVGAQIPSLNVLVEKGVWELADPRLLVGLAALGLLPWLIRPILRRLVFN